MVFMEMIFVGIFLFFLTASIFANLYFVHMLKETYSTVLNLALDISSIKEEFNDLRLDIAHASSEIFNFYEDFENFKIANDQIQSDIYQKLPDINYLNEVFITNIEALRAELKTKNENLARTNNWESVREAFARVNPKIQIKEQM